MLAPSYEMPVYNRQTVRCTCSFNFTFISDTHTVIQTYKTSEYGKVPLK